jgi:hypothetical protein
MEPFRLYGSERLSRQSARSPFPPVAGGASGEGACVTPAFPGWVTLDRAVARHRRRVAAHFRRSLYRPPYRAGAGARVALTSESSQNPFRRMHARYVA